MEFLTVATILSKNLTIVMQYAICYWRNVCALHPLNPYVDILAPNVMVLGGRAFVSDQVMNHSGVGLVLL